MLSYTKHPAPAAAAFDVANARRSALRKYYEACVERQREAFDAWMASIPAADAAFDALMDEPLPFQVSYTASEGTGGVILVESTPQAAA